jgi:HSP20 family protein
MSVFYYEPFYDFDRFFDSFLSPRTVRNFGGDQQGQRRVQGDASPEGAVRALKPRMDLHEDKEKNVVTASFEFPGSKKEDVHLEIQNGRLTVSVENKISDEYNESGYAVRERRFGKFSRTLQLPQGVKDDEIKASMENGLLTITFPKSAAELTAKKITIS